MGIGLYQGNIFLHVGHQCVEHSCFHLQYLVLGPQDFLLIFFQFLRDIPFGLCKRLFAHPRLGHLVLVQVAHLEIIAKHIVIAYFQRGDARGLDFALLQLQQIVLAAVGHAAQLVELIVHPVLDDAALAGQLRRVFAYLPFNALAHPLAQTDLFGHAAQGGMVGLGASLFHGH